MIPLIPQRQTSGVISVPRSGRRIRTPNHQFNFRIKPWQLQPVVLAPVIPGETLKNALIQARVVTDPIIDPLTGWWLEFYLFYVKHRDLSVRTTLEAMMLQYGTSVAGIQEAASERYYHAANSINWARLCTERVVEEFFRNEGESATVATINGTPAVSINDRSWTDSLSLTSEITAIDIDLTDAGSPSGTAVTASEIDSTMRQWEFLRANQLIEMSYEDWLATFGVRQATVELHRPELLRYVREWAYPANTVDPISGTPSSAVSWAIQGRADKDRFFSEPGFVLGLCAARPKVYRSTQVASASDFLQDAFSWLPALMQADPATSLKSQATATGPVPSLAGYTWDARDLFLYGDQFVNYDVAEIGNGVALPDDPGSGHPGGINRSYADEAMADALFIDNNLAEPPETIREYVRGDGICRLSIATVQVDATPGAPEVA